VLTARQASRLQPGLTYRRGLVLIQSQIASNVAAVDFTKGIDALYDEYVFEGSEIVPQTDGTALHMRFSTDGGSSFLAANYRHSRIINADGSVPAGGGSASDAQIILYNGLGNASVESGSFRVFLHAPASSLYKLVHSSTTGIVNSNSASSTAVFVSGTYTGATSAINAVRFLMSSGNINGKFKLFGVRKA
jgi:hypothetical protein